MNSPATTGRLILSVTWLALVMSAARSSVTAQEEPVPSEVRCALDLSKPGKMKDIVSNALLRGFDFPTPGVKEFLRDAEIRYDTGPDLLKAAADHFEVSEARMSAQVEKYRHCNCDHPGGELFERRAERASEAPLTLSPFARDVTLHVVLHELAHALIREFDLPVLANEETMADAFATYYLTTHLPDRALSVLQARTTSWMIEAGEVPRAEWDVSGEHNSDARRAHQVAALALAADQAQYLPLATALGMSESDIRSATDYGSEIMRSWRRVLAPLWMPDGLLSRKTRVEVDDESDLLAQLCTSEFVQLLDSILGRFDWHTQVTVHFADSDGGAGWSRSRRTVTVNSGYVRRLSNKVHSERTDSGGPHEPVQLDGPFTRPARAR